MVEPIFQKPDFEVTDGEASIYSLQSQGSGKQVQVHFCSRSGTKIYLSFERFPDVVGVYAGTFDNPSWFDTTPETTAFLFLDSAAAGAIVTAGVPVYRKHRLSSDGRPNEAIVFAAPHQAKLAE